MAYVINEGKGPKVAVYSSCTDISYAQAEVLFMSERVLQKTPNAFVVAYFDQLKAISVTRFLSAFDDNPADLKRLEELRSEILSKGFQAFTKRTFEGAFSEFANDKASIKIGRCAEELVDHVVDRRNNDDGSDLSDLVEDLYANPLHAGIHYDFKASVPDEVWIQDAVKAAKRTSLDRYLRRMLLTLRFYLKGQPKVPTPHKNDRCPCGSSRKYGKCCGLGIEPDDPDECKLGNHQYRSWEKVENKWIRSCERCFRVYEAPWAEESTFEGINVILVGCRACGNRPTPEDIHKEISRATGWHTCGSCGKAFTLGRILIEHEWQDGKHADHWVATEIAHTEESVDLESKSLWKGIFLHKSCFMKALPAWPTVAKPLGDQPKGSISREIAPTSS